MMFKKMLRSRRLRRKRRKKATRKERPIDDYLS